MTSVSYPADATEQELATARLIGGLLEEWFRTYGRDLPWRHWRDMYRATITEALLQRTRAEVVANFVDWFFRRYPSPAALVAVPISVLEADLAVLGLQRRRAPTLQALGRAIEQGIDVTVIGAAPGVGQYLSRAVAVTLTNAPVAMVDANFVRIVRRVYAPPWKADYRHDGRLQAIALAVVQPPRDSRMTNWAVLDLGSAVCRPRSPRCVDCPIAPHCRTGRENLSL